MSLLLKWGRELVVELGLVTRQDLDELLDPIRSRLEAFMANVAPLLNTLADDLAAFAEGPFAALLADDAQKTADLAAAQARIAELEGTAADTAAAAAAEDTEEETAAERAVDAFNALSNPVTSSPDVPATIPVVEVPQTPDSGTPDESPFPTEDGGGIL